MSSDEAFAILRNQPTRIALRYVAEGRDEVEIAQLMGLTLDAIRTMLGEAARALRAESRQELIDRAIELLRLDQEQ
jgi:DNA-binding NarL/FixJ family response regulator